MSRSSEGGLFSALALSPWSSRPANAVEEADPQLVIDAILAVVSAVRARR